MTSNCTGCNFTGVSKPLELCATVSYRQYVLRIDTHAQRATPESLMSNFQPVRNK
jgi:hypothetical protein